MLIFRFLPKKVVERKKTMLMHLKNKLPNIWMKIMHSNNVWQRSKKTKSEIFHSYQLSSQDFVQIISTRTRFTPINDGQSNTGTKHSFNGKIIFLNIFTLILRISIRFSLYFLPFYLVFGHQLLVNHQLRIDLYH